jgi:hypothetical protein
VFVRHGRKRSRKARAGRPYFVRDHDLCGQCWQSFHDQFVARQLALQESQNEDLVSGRHTLQPQEHSVGMLGLGREVDVPAILDNAGP